jgi:hypothetical protein
MACGGAVRMPVRNRDRSPHRRGKSGTAAIEILLPLGAAAVGMTALGIVFELAQRYQI